MRGANCEEGGGGTLGKQKERERERSGEGMRKSVGDLRS